MELCGLFPCWLLKLDRPSFSRQMPCCLQPVKHGLLPWRHLRTVYRIGFLTGIPEDYSCKVERFGEKLINLKTNRVLFESLKSKV